MRKNLKYNRPYIAGRMTGGKDLDGKSRFDLAAIHEALEVYATLITLGYVPICPQLSAFVEFLVPGRVSYEEWLNLDMEYINQCDCLLRLPGESAGADKEVEYARSISIPVFYGPGEFFLGTMDKELTHAKA